MDGSQKPVKVCAPIVWAHRPCSFAVVGRHLFARLYMEPRQLGSRCKMTPLRWVSVKTDSTQFPVSIKTAPEPPLWCGNDLVASPTLLLLEARQLQKGARHLMENFLGICAAWQSPRGCRYPSHQSHDGVVFANPTSSLHGHIEAQASLTVGPEYRS